MAAANRAKMPFDSKSFLAKIGTGQTNLNFSKDENIFTQGDPADSIFYLQTGNAKIFVTAANGKEAVVALAGTGDFLGESCLLGQPLRTASASAMTDVQAMRIEKAAMTAVLKKEIEFAQVFIEHLLRRKRRAEDDLVDQLFNSSEKRLARALLLLANFGSDDKSKSILATISQETLAEMVGTTRSRISHFMTKFRRLGLIETKGRLKVNTVLLQGILDENNFEGIRD